MNLPHSSRSCISIFGEFPRTNWGYQRCIVISRRCGVPARWPASFPLGISSENGRMSWQQRATLPVFALSAEHLCKFFLFIAIFSDISVIRPRERVTVDRILIVI